MEFPSVSPSAAPSVSPSVSLTQCFVGSSGCPCTNGGYCEPGLNCNGTKVCQPTEGPTKQPTELLSDSPTGSSAYPSESSPPSSASPSSMTPTAYKRPTDAPTTGEPTRRQKRTREPTILLESEDVSRSSPPAYPPVAIFFLVAL